MSLTIILSIIIIILIMAMVLNQKFMKDRVETEEYARNLSLIHISEPTRQCCTSRMQSSA